MPENNEKLSHKIRIVAKSIRRAFLLVWQPSPYLTVLQFCIAIFGAFLPAIILWTTKQVIDLIVISASKKEIQSSMIAWILILAVAWIIQKGLTCMEQLVSVVLSCRVEQHTNALIMRKCSQLDIAFFEKPANLNMLENATRGALVSAYAVVSRVFSFIRSIVTVVFMLIILASLHWIAVVVVVVTTLPQMVVSCVFAKRHWAMLNDLAEDYRLRHYLCHLVSEGEAAKEIRLFDLSSTILERYKGFCEKYIKKEVRFNLQQSAADMGLSVLAFGGMAGCWIYIALRAIYATISIGDVVMFTQAVSNTQTNLVSLFAQGGRYYEQTLFLQNLFKILDMDPCKIEGSLTGPCKDRKERWGAIKAPMRLKQGIEFRSVSFRYPGATDYVLRNVSFTLKPGESVALAGKNGAGKTTLVKLLVRLYDPTEGEILFEGRRLEDYDLHSLHKCFGVIFQDFVRYVLTARENIGFGQVEQVNNMPAIQLAARRAGVDTFIDKLPEGYETYLGKTFGGLATDLSGGEWQGMGIARAYMRTSPILILDEPTASLDVFKEYEVYRSFAEMMDGKMSIVISHRFSTVKNARHIIVLDGGRVIEEGSHDTLIEMGGLYAEMFNLQADNYK